MRTCIIDNPPMIICSVEVSSDLSWQVYIFGYKQSSALIKELPLTIHNISSLEQILSTIHKAHLCPGNEGRSFCTVA